MRLALELLAIPLAPLLFKDHFVLLVLMRPTKEVLLAAGFLLREGDVTLPPVLLALLPLFLPGVWLFYVLAQAYAREISQARLPWLVGRLLPPKRIKAIAKAVQKHDTRVVFLGRLAAFPSSVVAAAAGAAKVDVRRFLAADLAGALVSLVILIGAGYGLGEAHDEAGPFITAVGVAALVALAIGLGRYLRNMDGK